MTGEQVLRVILVKQLGMFSYDELAFHLADSLSYRAFCRMDIGHPIPNKKTLQRNVKKVEAITLERINVLLVEHAVAASLGVASHLVDGDGGRSASGWRSLPTPTCRP